jgi:hypothetical protein
VFGGVTAERPNPYSNALWAWDGASWTCLSAGDADGRTAPWGRMDAFFAMDEARGRAVLFGGRAITADRRQIFYADTWEWDGRAWTKRASEGPAPRIHGAIGYDATLGAVVMVGGGGRDDVLRDAWKWNGDAGRWDALPHAFAAGIADALVRTDTSSMLLTGAPDSAPACDGLRRATLWRVGADGYSPIAGANAPCFSPVTPAAASRDGIVMYAGWDGPNHPATTWTWSNGTWRQATGAMPPRRRGAAMTYDAARRVTVLIGGDGESGLLDDVWEWNGSVWRQVRE